jgi:hypothetical protein
MNLNINEIEEKKIYNEDLFKKIKKVEKNENKKISYDDILSSLQMKVVNGKLQFQRTDDAEIAVLSSQKKEQPKKVVAFSQPQKQFYGNQINNPLPNQQPVKMAQKTLKTRHLPIPQEYLDEKPQVPMTRQEAIIEYLKSKQEAARINQIKSKKLLFATNNINIAPKNVPTMSNMFFKFK